MMNPCIPVIETTTEKPILIKTKTKEYRVCDLISSKQNTYKKENSGLSTIHGVSVSVLTVCKGGFTRSSSSSTTSDPCSSFARVRFAIVVVTHSPSIVLL